MDPRDFITLAIKLSNSANEGERRTAVNRAYFGAFHLAREFLEDCGIVFSRKELDGAEIHRKVRFCLSESHDADGIFAGDKLRSLRQQRNEADYDLKSMRFRISREVAASIRAAQEIDDALRRCRAEPGFTDVREKIRVYASDVLRLTVDGS
jgi:uncharacterized protein (UPF0332 family)